MKGVNVIYDQLFDFESSNKDDFYPIHKKLRFKSKQVELVDWILSNIMFNQGESVLDAGCGTGYTLYRLAKEKNIKGQGISISSKEISFANKQLANKSQSLNLNFKQQSFDQPFESIFDKIIAIESIKHSENITISIKNLCDAISTNGAMIIADDFVKKESFLIGWHKKLWNAESFISFKQLERIFDKIGHFKIKRIDFTDQVKTRPTVLLAILIPITFLSKWLCMKKHRTKIEIFLGGLLLEFLYNNKMASYFVITATKI